ncbi:DUF4350 domain-containing protein [Siminovitchia fortis]|uniref:DUF4350 domain-containing protein n=1 Tax=Siminovitchia fortis TaxID=254758 RepID=A0A443IZ43_9BACI|nr:DUF4350 domain-containing protein [Siminovitchia fortis]RWR13538.1 DUF4350 domain-containing protein [Siminovitchia fortis]WHY81781.1 DUF4350 domain-containing protein [Siminovitchia fortis]
MQRSGKRTWILLSILLLCFLAGGYFLQSKQPAAYPAYVSDSPSPTGTKAIYTYLKEESESVQRWKKPPQTLDAEDGGQVLVMVEPLNMPKSEEMKAYEKFMEAGNTILLFQRNPQGMFDLVTDPVEAGAEEGILYDQKDSRNKAEISYLNRMQTEQGDDILLYDDAGTIALERPYGDGRLIVSIFPEWMTNGQILKKDHVSLLTSLLNETEGRQFLFDEYVHKPQGGEKALNVYPMWFLLFMFQGGILAILWLWYQGKRFGPIFSPREATVRFSDEGIRALAAWYMRSRRYHDSIAIQADYLKLVLQEKWHIPYREEWRSLAPLLERKSQGRMGKKEIDSFLSGLTDVLNKERLSKQEYLLWSKKIDRLRKVVEER